MILIVDMNWKKDSLGYFEFVLPIARIVEPLDGFTIKHYLEIGEKDIDPCEKIILSGTALKDNTVLSQPEKFQWLKLTKKPLLGICAGMETIGIVYGMPMVQCVEIGMTQISTLRANQLFEGDFRAYSLHSLCVEPSPQFDVLAKSPQCVQVIKHKSKEIYGVLFHPEVRNQEVLKNFIIGNTFFVQKSEN